jgi:hypothetical protein
MSDSEIVEGHNESLRNEAMRAAEYKHVVFEVPLAQRKSNILLDVISAFQEVVCCAP